MTARSEDCESTPMTKVPQDDTKKVSTAMSSLRPSDWQLTILSELRVPWPHRAEMFTHPHRSKARN
jgi:hypothetical protein